MLLFRAQNELVEIDMHVYHCGSSYIASYAVKILRIDLVTINE